MTIKMRLPLQGNLFLIAINEFPEIVIPQVQLEYPDKQSIMAEQKFTTICGQSKGL